MANLFLKILNMSISASWIVIAVLLFRFLFKKAPKWINVVLWGVVGLRLIMPFSFESVLSLIPSTETVSPEIMMDMTPQIDIGIDAVNNAINPIITGSFAPEPMASANPLQIIIPVISNLWLLGVALLFVYSIISYLRLKFKIGTAVLYNDNIYQSENVASPFVLGIIKPKIYLPFNIDEQDMSHVIAHEMAHIKRKDYLWKPLGFLLLTLHWFNPLMWVGYLLLCRDIELACDQKVINELTNEQKADYSQALLTCSINRRIISACPLAFGEVGVKDRVKSVLNYKKPAFWIIIVAVITSIALAVCFLTDPVKQDGDISTVGGVDDSNVQVQIFTAEQVTEALLNPTTQNKYILEQTTYKNTSMGITFPKVDPSRIAPISSPKIETLPAKDEFIRELTIHGITDYDITLYEYQVIERTWLLDNEMILITKGMYPELENVDLSNWTIGDKQEYDEQRSNNELKLRFTTEQLVELKERGIEIEDTFYLFKEFHNADNILNQTDQVLKETIEGYYRTYLSFALGEDAYNKIAAKYDK